MKILVVEDDATVALAVQDLLTTHHYAVDLAADGLAGLEMAEAYDYALILLDIRLPRLDGVSLCQQLRAQGLATPILLLTGQESEGPTKAIALNAGADDYMTKPFDGAELLARVQSLLRRGDLKTQPILTWGLLSVDPGSLQVSYDHHLLHLTPKEFSLLEVLLRHAPNIVSAQMILEQGWSALEAPGEETIRTHLKALRKKLKTVGAPADFVKTVHRLGYRLNPLYGAIVFNSADESEKVLQMAELRATNAELRRALEQSQAAQVHLQATTRALELAHQSLRQEHQQLQAAYAQLAARSAELPAVHSLEQPQSQYQALFDQALEALLMADDAGCYVAANPAACELFGVSRAVLLQSGIVNFVDPALDLTQVWQQFLQQGHMSEELRLYRPDGEVRETEFKAIANFIPGRHLLMLRDISDRKQLERSLQASATQLSRILNTARAAIGEFFAYSDGSFTHGFMSPGCEVVYGYTQTELRSDPELWRSRVFPEDFENVIIPAFEQIFQGQTLTIEYRFRDKNGQLRWIAETLISQWDEAAGRWQVTTLATDISDRKQAELEIRKFAALAENSSEFIGMSDLNLVPFYLNPAGRQLLGIETADGAPDASVLDCFFPEDRDFITQEFFPRVLLEGHGEVEIRFRHLQTGAALWMIYSVICIQDETGNPIAFATISHDISDRKRLELELQTSKDQLNRILDNAIAAISSFRVYANQEWEYEYWSAGCERLYGYTLADLSDKYFWMSRVMPEDREQVLMPLFDDFFAERDAMAEYRFRRQDGEVRWFSSAYTSRQIAADCWLVTTVNHDITERKQAELSLQQQLRQDSLLTDMALDIRQSLNLNAVLSRTVDRVREFLRCDRVIIFRFRPDWQGDVIMESVAAGWDTILATTISDPCFADRFIEPYRQGRVSATTDITQRKLQPCYVQLLETFQVKANLVVPILQGENLWGLLIAHHCAAPRLWQPTEITMLQRIATQASLAIQQAELYEQVQQELTERVRMQTVLEESEERFRTLSAAAPVGILQTNADGICLYANDYWQMMSGLSVAESLGAGWQQVIHPQDRESVVQHWETHLHNRGECQAEFRLLTPQGKIRWVAARAAAIHAMSGEVIGNVCIFTDITAQKQALQQIHQQAALLDIASDAIFVRDLNHGILYWNRGAEQIFGWTTGEAIGQRANTLLQSAQAQIDSIMPILLERDEWQGEMHKLTKTGQSVTISARWTLMRDEAGRPQSILCVETDITEKKSLEAQFYQAQRLESLGTLASGIAHDLNNVLTPILMIAQLLQLSQSGLDNQGRERLKMLENSAKRGANLVKQILTVTRGSQGERTTVNLAALLREVVSIIQQSFPKTIEIRPELPTTAEAEPSLGIVFADPTHLHQVLLNLCINARDAMPEGGTLTLAAATVFVDEAMAARNLGAQVGHYAVVSITDTGTGITPEVRDRMFDPFFTTKGPGQGTGLGLATVLGLVKAYNGFLQVFSEVGQGSEFRVYLPILEPDAVLLLHPQPTSETGLNGRGELILIVEDDEMVRGAIQALLENHHYRTLLATDGATAIEQYRRHQADIQLVISDVMMPNIDGIALIRHLTALDPAVRIIALSGLPAHQEATLAAGAYRFLVKPYGLSTLLNILWELFHLPDPT